jgi:3'-phosphoadenosine 5'-phosphosulfate sulfotransferase (PAPS reductase)/FAD synthetase
MDNTPDLSGYDLIVVNTSGGKDSSALLIDIVERAKAAGVLDRVVLVHAVLREEWPGTVELVQAHAAHYGLPLHLAHAKRSLLVAIRRRGRWPSRQARYCTSDHKRGPIEVVIRRLAKERGARTILNCLGLRAAESPARAKRVPFERNLRLSRAGRQVDTWLPIFRLSVAEVWASVKAAGLGIHPAYALGMPRLSCCFCIFAPKAGLILAGRENPDLLREYVQIEQEIGHSFRQDLKIADVLTAVEAGDAPGPVSSWEM